MRLSILSFGVSLLGLPAALAQVPVPAQYTIPPLTPAPVPFKPNVLPHSSQATLTGVPALPPAPPIILPVQPHPMHLSTLTWSYTGVPASTKPKTRVFEVADLVHAPLQIPGAAALENTKGTSAHTLMKLIVAMAKPDTWERHGGAGKIEFIAASDSLCVTNSPEAVAEVAKVLEGLRRMQDSQVFLEVTLLTAPAGFGAKAGWPTVDDKGKAAPKHCTPDEVKKAVAAMKGDPRVSVFSRPAMTLTDGQAGNFQVCQQVAMPPKTISMTTDGGKIVPVVCIDTLDIGTKFECVPTVSMDGKTIALKLNTLHSALNNGGGVSTIQNRSSIALPCGNSAIVYLGTMTAEERIETRVPALSKLPYLDRLFRNTGIGKVEQDVYQIVTVRKFNEADSAAPDRPSVRVIGAVVPAPCCKPSVQFELNLTAPKPGAVVGQIFSAPKPIVVPNQVFSFYTGWIGQ